MNPHSKEWVEHMNQVEPGGVWKPKTCTARHKVLIITPYRDREEHLSMLLSHLHPILQRQMVEYRIVVVEQVIRLYQSDFFFKNYDL